MNKLILLILISLTLAFSVSGNVYNDDEDHEYAPITEKEIEYKNWTYNNVTTGESVSLREFSKDKKLVLVFYLAHWCHSSNYQAPFTEALYKKYKDKGFAVVGVSLYGNIEDTQNKLRWWLTSFPVVGESFSTKDRKTSLHYGYRTATGDTRKWATPWNIFLSPSDFKPEGDTLVDKAFVANGELVETEAETFIREKLGLPAEEGPDDGATQ